MTKKLKEKLKDLLAEIELAERDVSDMMDMERAKANEAVELAKEEHREAVEAFEKTIKELEEKNAERDIFWEKIDAEVIGLLELDSMQKSLVFEKLSDSWEFIDSSKLDAIESILNDNFTAKNGKVWLM